MYFSCPAAIFPPQNLLTGRHDVPLIGGNVSCVALRSSNRLLPSIAVQSTSTTCISAAKPRTSLKIELSADSCSLRAFQGSRPSWRAAAFTAEPSISSYEDDNAMSSTEKFALDIPYLQSLQSSIRRLASWDAKVWRLHEEPHVSDFFKSRPEVRADIERLPTDEQYVLTCTVAVGQEHVLVLHPEGCSLLTALADLAKLLLRVEKFYDSMGGIIGYQLKSLELIAQSFHPERLRQSLDRLCKDEPVCYLVPRGVDLGCPEGEALAHAAALDGLDALPDMAEIYPVGGAGDRLGLKCELTGESLPAALLRFGGFTMLENLLRDLQAREYLYYKLTGRQLTTPVAIMTSDAKGNHRRIINLLESLNWMGRGKESFRLFRQPLVPVLCVDDGKWMLKGPSRLMMKPGGHGVIWKLMRDEGVFDWLTQQKRQAAVLRQVSNPMAGVDTTLLALAGAGRVGCKVFGFMSCERAVGAAEGMNVLVERRKQQMDPTAADGYRTCYSYGVSNIEYTEFEKLGISDESRDGETNVSVFPANTNILYVGLPELAQKVNQFCNLGGESMLPGLIFNMKKKVTYSDPLSGSKQLVRAGRMECTMQNAADWFTDDFNEPLIPEQIPRLSTFIVQNLRRKVTSSAKKKREVGSNRIRQTPDGALYDLIGNAWHLLRSCGMECIPQLSDVETYLADGPDFLFFFHPALGPTWDVIAQKIRGGSLAQHSELVLEVAEAELENVHIAGSLVITADQVMGHFTPPLSEPDIAPPATPSKPTPPHTAPPKNPYTHPPTPWDPASCLNTPSASQPQAQGPGTSVSAAPWESRTPVASPAFPLSPAPPTASRVNLPTNAAPLAPDKSDNGSKDGDGRARVMERGAGNPSTPVCGDHNLRSAPPQGAGKGQRGVYSSQCGRVRLVNVRVENRGVDWEHPDNIFWKCQVQHDECCKIILEGHAEFTACDVTLSGSHTFEVPDGHRLLVSACPETNAVVSQLLKLESSKPSWQWCYERQEGSTAVLRREQHD